MAKKQTLKQGPVKSPAQRREQEEKSQRKQQKKKQNNAFWADMMSGANGGISSKRVLGSFILMVLLVVIVINTFWGNQNTWLGEAFITMLVGAYALLGIGVFEKRFNKSPEHHYKDQFDEPEDDYEGNNEEDQCS